MGISCLSSNGGCVLYMPLLGVTWPASGPAIAVGHSGPLRLIAAYQLCPPTWGIAIFLVVLTRQHSYLDIFAKYMRIESKHKITIQGKQFDYLKYKGLLVFVILIILVIHRRSTALRRAFLNFSISRSTLVRFD